MMTPFTFSTNIPTLPLDEFYFKFKKIPDGALHRHNDCRVEQYALSANAEDHSCAKSFLNNRSDSPSPSSVRTTDFASPTGS